VIVGFGVVGGLHLRLLVLIVLNEEVLTRLVRLDSTFELEEIEVVGEAASDGLLEFGQYLVVFGPGFSSR